MKHSFDDNSGLQYTQKIDDLLMADTRERMFQEYIIAPFLESILPEYDVVPVDNKISGNAHDYSKYCGSYGYDKEGKLCNAIETPDLCIAQGWKWINDGGTTDYFATVEIKTPFSDNSFWIAPGYDLRGDKFDRDVEGMVNYINTNMLRKVNGKYDTSSDASLSKCIEKQVGIHLRGINKVIVTDGIRWLFFYKDDKDICHALDPIDLGKRICEKPKTKYAHIGIEWDVEKIVLKRNEFTTGPKNFTKLVKQIQDFCSKDFPVNRKKIKLKKQ